MDQPEGPKFQNHACEIVSRDQDSIPSAVSRLLGRLRNWGGPGRRRVVIGLAKVTLWLLNRLITLDGLIVFSVLLVVLPLLLLEMYRYPRIVVDPISVPLELENIGYTPDVVARRLVDGIHEFPDTYRFIGMASLCKQPRPISPSVDLRHESSVVDLSKDRGVVTPSGALKHDQSRPDFVVPGMGLSIRAVAAYLRNRFYPPITVSGELVYTRIAASLRLRVDGRKVGDITRKKVDERVIEQLEQLFREGAHQVIEQSDPSKLGLEFANLYNNFGLLLVNECNYDDAIDKFQKAVEIDPNFAEALYNWGYVLGIHKGEYALAAEKFEKADKLRNSMWR